MEINRKRVARRLASGLVAGALALGGLAMSGATPANATAAPTVQTRIAGADRYATANAVALAMAGTRTNIGAIVLASGENFPDGLAASALAGAIDGAQGGSPLLLVPSGDSLPTSVLTTISTIKSAPYANTITDVVIVGGTSVISASVETQLEAMGYTVTRFAGADRIETANLVAAAVFANNGGTIGTFGGYKTAFLANSNNFPDALAASSWAFRNKHPLFLTDGSSLTAGTKAAMTAAGVQQVIILGGTAAVSAEAATEAAGVSGVITTTRVSGDTRYDTATALATTLATVDADYKTRAMLVSGTNFPDALAAAQLAGQADSYAIIPVTSPLPAAVSTWATANQATLSTIRAIGGTSAIADDVVTAVKSGATIAPLTATITATDGSTSVKVTFSGNVDSSTVVAGSFLHRKALGGTGTITSVNYVDANAALGTPATATFTIAAAYPGDVIEVVAGAIKTTALLGSVPVAPTSVTVAADTTPVTAEITAFASAAAGVKKIWVTVSDNLAYDAATTPAALATALTVTSGAIGGAVAGVTNCVLVTGSEYIFHCDLSGANPLVAGDKVTLPAASLSSSATIPAKNAAASTTVVTDAAGPNLVSATYSMSAALGTQASISLIDAATDAAPGGGELAITARSTGIAAGKAGNAWTIEIIETGVTTPSVVVSAASKKLTVRADAGDTASDVAAALNANADFTANFIANVTTSGVLTALADTSTANDNAFVDLIAGLGGTATDGEVTITALSPGTAMETWAITTDVGASIGAVATGGATKTLVITAAATDTAAAVVAALNADDDFNDYFVASVETAGAMTGYTDQATAFNLDGGNDLFLTGGTDLAVITATFSEPLAVQAGNGIVADLALSSGETLTAYTTGVAPASTATVALQQAAGILVAYASLTTAFVPGVTKLEATAAKFEDRNGVAMTANPLLVTKQAVPLFAS